MFYEIETQKYKFLIYIKPFILFGFILSILSSGTCQISIKHLIIFLVIASILTVFTSVSVIIKNPSELENDLPKQEETKSNNIIPNKNNRFLSPFREFPYYDISQIFARHAISKSSKSINNNNLDKNNSQEPTKFEIFCDSKKQVDEIPLQPTFEQITKEVNTQCQSHPITFGYLDFYQLKRNIFSMKAEHTTKKRSSVKIQSKKECEKQFSENLQPLPKEKEDEFKAKWGQIINNDEVIQDNSNELKDLIENSENRIYLRDIYKTFLQSSIAYSSRNDYSRMYCFGRALSIIIPFDSQYRKLFESVAIEMIPLADPTHQHSQKTDSPETESSSVAYIFVYWCHIRDYDDRLVQWIAVHAQNDKNGNDEITNAFGVWYFLRYCAYPLSLYFHNNQKFKSIITSILHFFETLFANQTGRDIDVLQDKIKKFNIPFLQDKIETFKQDYNDYINKSSDQKQNNFQDKYNGACVYV